MIRSFTRPLLTRKVSTALFFLFILALGRALGQNMVTYAGNSGKERFLDVMELSNGKVLVAGRADNLAWVPNTVPISTLTLAYSPGYTDPQSSDASVAFLALLSTDQSTIEAVVRFPANTVADVSRIRTTNQPGQTTGFMYISGQRTSSTADGYYIAKLNNNFVAGLPTATSWYYPASAPPRGAVPSAYKESQPWDVGGDGNVLFGIGTDFSFDWGAIYKLNSITGDRMVVNDWPAHWGNGGWTSPGAGQTVSEYEWDGTPASSAPATVQVRKKSTPKTSPVDSTITYTIKYSAIVLKVGRAGSLRSMNLTDYLADGFDENNNPRKGKYPDDWFFNGPLGGSGAYTGTARGLITVGTSYGPAQSGYYAKTPIPRLVALVIDRRDNHLYYGYSVQTVLPSGQPDFEPCIVAMGNTGKMKWWARLYNQKAVSEPDQYIDALEVDYANDHLAVLARQHGSGTNVYWKGNQLAYSSGQAFQNAQTGVNTVQTGHYSWIGKYDLIRTPSFYPTFPKILKCTYMGEYSDNPSGLGSPSSDPKLDGWPTPNSGYPDLNTTKGVTRMACTKAGGVVIMATGRRTITTADAFQKMRKPWTGSVSSWNNYVRVYRPDLSSLIYSSLLTGAWDTLTGSGGSNVNLTGAWPGQNSVFVTGYHVADPSSGSAQPNAMPTTAVPGWGNAAPQAEQAVFGRLNFENFSPITLTSANNFFCTTSPNNTYALAFVPPPSFLVSFNVGNQFVAEISNSAGKFADQGGSSTTIGTLSSVSNAQQSINVTLTGFTPGTGYGVRVRATNPVTPGYWYSATIVNAQPNTPGSITGATQVCANSAGASTYTINKVAGASTYEWKLIPTENPNPPPACNQDPGCAGIVTSTDTTATIVWNPSYSGSATLQVRANNPCGTSAWQTLSIPQIAPCITTTFTGTYCEGQSAVKIPFAVPSNVTTNGGNIYTAQLSDAAGSFASPTSLGTKTIATGAGPRQDTVLGTFPLGTLTAGSNYLVRVVATGVAPAAQGAPSLPITIKVRPGISPTPTGVSAICYVPDSVQGYKRYYSITPVAGAIQYVWEILPANAGQILQGTDATMRVLWNNNPGTVQVRVKAINDCGAGTFSAYFTTNLGSCLATNQVSGQTWCAGATMAKTTPGGSTNITISKDPSFVFYNTNVYFTYEISDPNGDFTIPISYYNSPASTDGLVTPMTASVVIPGGTVTGSGYRVRARCVDNCYNNITGNTRYAPVYSSPIALTISNVGTTQLLPPTGAVTGVCGTTQTYTVGALAGATGYTWTLSPASAGTVTPSGTTASIAWSNTYTGASANIFVSATLPCGQQAAAPLAVSTNCNAPTGPPTVTCAATPAYPSGTTSPGVNNAYRSNGAVNFTSVTNWQKWNGSAWVAATQVPGSIGDNTATDIYINATLTVDASNTLGTNGVVYQTTGAISISSGFTLTIANGTAAVDGHFGGTISANGGNLVGTGAIQIKSGATYTHAYGSGGAFPTATWCDGSAAIVTTNNSTATPTNLAQNFWNWTWNSGSMSGNMYLQPHGMQVRNLFYVQATNSKTLVMSDGSTAGSMFADSIYINSSTAIVDGTGTNLFTVNCRGIGINADFNGNNPTNVVGRLCPPHILNVLQHPTLTNRGCMFQTYNNIIRVSRSTGAGTQATWNIYRDYLSNQGGMSFSVAGGTDCQGNLALNVGRDFVLSNAIFMNSGQYANNVSVNIGRDLTMCTVSANASGRCFNENFNPNTIFNLSVGRNFTHYGTSYVWGLVGNPSNGAAMPATLQTNMYVGGNINIAGSAQWAVRYNWSGLPPVNFKVAGTLNLSGGTFYASADDQNSYTHSPLDLTFGGINQTGGTFTINARNCSNENVAIKVVGNFSQSGGTFGQIGCLNEGYSLYVGGNFTHTGGQFDYATNWNYGGYYRPATTVYFSGSGAQTLTVNNSGTNQFNQQYIRLVLAKPSGTLTLGSSVFVPQFTWIAGNLNVGNYQLVLKDTTTYAPGRNLTIYGPALGVVGQLTGGTGTIRTSVLYFQRGILDNTIGNYLTVTGTGTSAVVGAADTNYVAGSLGLALAASASSAQFNYPIGSLSAYRPLSFYSLVNDASAKVLKVGYGTSGPNQASGTGINNVGLTSVGAANWQISRISGSGNLSSVGQVSVRLTGLDATMRIGQSTSLATGYASVGGDLSAPTIYTTKPLNVSAMTTGLYLAIGSAVTVAPPGGGYTVGPGGDFANLTQVAAHYNDVTFSGPATFTFNATYNGKSDDGTNPAPETFPIYFKNNQTYPVTIRYQGSTTIETSNSIANPVQEALVVLDGAQKITFSGNDKWRFLNKAKCDACAAFRLQNDAVNHNLTDLILEGSGINLTYNGVVHLASSTKTLGNSNNVINSSVIRSNNERRRVPQITAIANNNTPGLPPGAVIDASNTNPITITTAGPHNLTTGDKLLISGVLGNNAANGYWAVTVTGSNTFTIPTAGSGNFTVSEVYGLQVNSVSGNVVTTNTAHNFRDYMEVALRTASSTSAGSVWIDSLTATTFACYGDPGLTQSYNPSGVARAMSVYANGCGTPSITGVSNASPIQVTISAPHNLVTGQAVWIKGVLGNTAANGVFLITKVNNYSFTLQGSTGNGLWTGGGYFLSPPLVATTSVAHGLANGQQLSIGGITGVTTANGTHYVTVHSPTVFSMWTDNTYKYPRNITNPIPNTTGMSATRPGLPISLPITSITINPGFITVTTSANIGAAMLGKSFRVTFNRDNGILNGAYCGTVTATGSGTSAYTVSGSFSGTYVSGGVASAALTVDAIDNRYRTGAPYTSFYNPQVSISASSVHSCMVIDDPFTLAGSADPTFNGTFRNIALPFGASNFGAWSNPTPTNPLFGIDPNPPYYGQIGGGRDSLVDKGVFSQNTGTTLNINNSVTGNEIFNFNTSGVGLNTVGNGGGWSISNNSFYLLPGTPPQGVSQCFAINFAAGAKSSGNIINGNYIGGTQSLAAGQPLSYQAGGLQFVGIRANVGTNSYTQIQNNIIKNFNFNLYSNAGNNGVQAAWLDDGAINFSNNVVGGTSTAPIDTIVLATQGINTGGTTLLSITSSGPVNVVGNTLAKMAIHSTSYGVSIAGNGSYKIYNNLVTNIGTDNQSLFNAFAVNGGTSKSILVDSNVVTKVFTTWKAFNVSQTNTAGTISRNRVYGNRGDEERGFEISATTNDAIGWRFINNEITSLYTARSSNGSYGVYLNHPTGGTNPKIWFNTIYMGGGNNTGPGAAAPLVALNKAGTGMADIRNNVLYSVGIYTGGTFPGYAIQVANTSGWNGSFCTNNLFYGANGQNNMANYNGTIINDITAWHATAGGANNLFASANYLYDQPAVTGNLHLSAENCPIKKKGVSVGTYDDFDSTGNRDKARPDLGANEFSKAIPSGAYWVGGVSSDWSTDANWCDNRVPESFEDVTISNAPSRRYMPVVSTPTATCRSLNLINNPGSMLVVHGANAALTITGKSPLVKFTNANLAHISGSIWFTSDSAQNIPSPAIAEGYARRNTNLPTVAISGITTSTGPDLMTVTTSAAHNLGLSDMVQIRGVKGLTNANVMGKVYQIVSATVFKIKATTSGSYTANTGRVVTLAAIPITGVAGSIGTNPITVTTPRVHGLSVGQYVTLAGVNGMSAANSSWQVLTVPTTTTFTVGATSNGNFAYDSSAYVLPGNTGYADLYLDGAGAKMADGVLYASSLNLVNGSFAVPAAAAIVRDSISVFNTAQLSLPQGGFSFGTINNYGGQIAISQGAYQLYQDSIRNIAGTTVLSGPFPNVKRLVNAGGSTTLNAGGTMNVSDSICLRGGIISLAGTTVSAKTANLRNSGTLNVSTATTLALADTLALRGGNMMNDGIVTVGNRLNLVKGSIYPNTSTTSYVSVTNNSPSIMGGNTNSYVQTALRQSINTVNDGVSFTPTSTANTSPIAVVKNNHGLNTGDVVLVTGINYGANGVWTITRLDNNNFTLDGTISGGATSGVGTIARMVTRNFPVGKGSTYRPTKLHVTQGSAVSTGYTVRGYNVAPPTRGYPVNQPAYPSGTDNILNCAVINYTEATSTNAANLAAGAMTMSYTTAEGVSNNNRRYLTVLKDSTGFANWLHLRGYCVDSLSSIRSIRNTRPFYSFSNFTLGFMQNQPLPVELLNFKGKVEGKRSMLAWQTASEQNADHFELERSYDGKTFSYLLEQPAAGNSNAVRKYNAFDETAFAAGRRLVYYRLKQVDRDGKHAYSQAIALRSTEAASLGLSAYPNPYTNQVTLTMEAAEAGTADFSVVDALGRTVGTFSQDIAAGSQQLAPSTLQALPVGAYVLRVRLAGVEQRIALVRQK